jgi:type II secretory pathway pseudopilin PulG
MSKYFGSHQSSYAILDRMKGGLKSEGFTIIETMMVLVVTAALFIMIAATLSGRQGRTEFSQSVQNVKNQIQQTINDVGSGFYPDTSNFKCSAGGSGPVFMAGASNQGANTGCIFVGKVLQFGIAGSSDPEQFRTYTLGGLQRDATGAEVTTYAAAKPAVISPSTTSPGTPDASDIGKLNYGLTTKEMYYGVTKTNIASVAFVNSLASYSNNSLVSGSQQVSMVPINGSALNASQPAGAQAINANFVNSANTAINPSSGVNICFVSAGSNQSGLITIGSNGRQLSVTLSIKENKTCS